MKCRNFRGCFSPASAWRISAAMRSLFSMCRSRQEFRQDKLALLLLAVVVVAAFDVVVVLFVRLDRERAKQPGGPVLAVAICNAVARVGLCRWRRGCSRVAVPALLGFGG